MKQIIKIVGVIFLVLIAGFFFLKAQIINNPTPEECETRVVEVTNVYEGGTFDINFKTKSGKTYYINRGLEQGLTIADLNKKVLYKSVTLHLPKVMMGTSTHISQMKVGDQVIFTEFN